MSKENDTPATKADVEELAGMMARESTATRDEVSEVNDRMDGVESRLESMEGRMDSMEGRLDSMDDKLDRIVDAVTGLPRRVEKLEKAAFGSRK